jgi:pimeloyl-ACP methyl ester carboxylesterase
MGGGSGDAWPNLANPGAPGKSAKWGGLAVAVAGALAISALVVRNKTRQAERTHPPLGQFIEIDGVRLHYIERGRGKPLVLLHGNGNMAEDFALSGFLDRAAQHYRVIAFDRPGFGHSDRPRNKIWTPALQAEFLHKALRRLGVEHCMLVGHSWGALVGLALACEYPGMTRALVLVSGYFYPSMRLDLPLASTPAIPLLGDLLSNTISPLLGRMMWPSLAKRLFGPAAVPQRFRDAYPVWMSLRPNQLRAAAGESALTIPAAYALKNRYSELEIPVMIVAGSEDQLVNSEQQSVRLHQEIPYSQLRLVPGGGHMLHYTAMEDVMGAIEQAEKEAQMHAAMQTVRTEALDMRSVH